MSYRRRRYSSRYLHGFGADQDLEADAQDIQAPDEGSSYMDDKPTGNKGWLLLALLAVGVGVFAWASAAKAEEVKGPLPKAPDEPPVPPNPPPAGPAYPTHTVVAGDSLSAIAKQYYGDWRWWVWLWLNNKAVVGCNWNLIFPGQVLSIVPTEGLDSSVWFNRPELKGWRNPPQNCENARIESA